MVDTQEPPGGSSGTASNRSRSVRGLFDTIRRKKKSALKPIDADPENETSVTYTAMKPSRSMNPLPWRKKEPAERKYVQHKRSTSADKGKSVGGAARRIQSGSAFSLVELDDEPLPRGHFFSPDDPPGQAPTEDSAQPVSGAPLDPAPAKESEIEQTSVDNANSFDSASASVPKEAKDNSQRSSSIKEKVNSIVDPLAAKGFKKIPKKSSIKSNSSLSKTGKASDDVDRVLPKETKKNTKKLSIKSIGSQSKTEEVGKNSDSAPIKGIKKPSKKTSDEPKNLQSKDDDGVVDSVPIDEVNKASKKSSIKSKNLPLKAAGSANITDSGAAKDIKKSSKKTFVNLNLSSSKTKEVTGDPLPVNEVKNESKKSAIEPNSSLATGSDSMPVQESKKSSQKSFIKLNRSSSKTEEVVSAVDPLATEETKKSNKKSSIKSNRSLSEGGLEKLIDSKVAKEPAKKKSSPQPEDRAGAVVEVIRPPADAISEAIETFSDDAAQPSVDQSVKERLSALRREFFMQLRPKKNASNRLSTPEPIAAMAENSTLRSSRSLSLNSLRFKKGVKGKSATKEQTEDKVSDTVGEPTAVIAKEKSPLRDRFTLASMRRKKKAQSIDDAVATTTSSPTSPSQRKMFHSFGFNTLKFKKKDKKRADLSQGPSESPTKESTSAVILMTMHDESTAIKFPACSRSPSKKSVKFESGPSSDDDSELETVETKPDYVRSLSHSPKRSRDDPLTTVATESKITRFTSTPVDIQNKTMETSDSLDTTPCREPDPLADQIAQADHGTSSLNGRQPSAC